MPKTVNIHDAKTHLSRLLEEVRKGERVIIAKAGEPIAELTPIRRADIVFGGLAGRVGFDDADFLAADADILVMFDEDLGLDAPA